MSDTHEIEMAQIHAQTETIDRMTAAIERLAKARERNAAAIRATAAAWAELSRAQIEGISALDATRHRIPPGRAESAAPAAPSRRQLR